MIVRDILQTKPMQVITVSHSANLSDVISLMSRHKVGSIVVLDSAGSPSGLLSENAVINYFATLGAPAMSQALSMLDIRAPYMIDCDAAVADVERTMTETRRRHALVIRGQMIVGLISIGDIVKARLVDARLESNVLRDMARSGLVAA